MKQTALSSLLRARDMRLVDLSRALGVDKATVSRWARRHIPHDRLEDVSRVTGIPAHELRPDLASIFGPPTSRPSKLEKSA